MTFVTGDRAQHHRSRSLGSKLRSPGIPEARDIDRKGIVNRDLCLENPQTVCGEPLLTGF